MLIDIDHAISWNYTFGELESEMVINFGISHIERGHVYWTANTQSDLDAHAWYPFEIRFKQPFNTTPVVSFSNLTGFSNENIWITALDNAHMIFSVRVQSIGFRYGILWQVIGV